MRSVCVFTIGHFGVHIEGCRFPGFDPFEADDERLQRFVSKAEALRHAKANAIQTSQGVASLFGEVKDWVRLEYSGYSVHYEFVEGALRMITIQSGDV